MARIKIDSGSNKWNLNGKSYESNQGATYSAGSVQKNMVTLFIQVHCHDTGSMISMDVGDPAAIKAVEHVLKLLKKDAK